MRRRCTAPWPAAPPSCRTAATWRKMPAARPAALAARLARRWCRTALARRAARGGCLLLPLRFACGGTKGERHAPGCFPTLARLPTTHLPCNAGLPPTSACMPRQWRWMPAARRWGAPPRCAALPWEAARPAAPPGSRGRCAACSLAVALERRRQWRCSGWAGGPRSRSSRRRSTALCLGLRPAAAGCSGRRKA